MALQVALQKAVEKYGVSRIFTFHGSVAAARSFTSDDGDGIRQHLPDFTTLHVSGEMATSRREDQMKAFRQADKAVISNARCLTEGVDVPAVDMVAFISPRKSKVDIVQATGRAMRRSPGKEFGYVMVPLFVEQASDESIEEALKRTGFDDVWDLLGAMKEQDEVLTDIIREMREDKGRTGGYNEGRFAERVDVLGPSVSLETIRGAITAECLDTLGSSWDEWIGKLWVFATREGHCLVSGDYRTPDGYRLGQWVGTQRRNKINLSDDRRNQLETLPGWSWNIHGDRWNTGFRLLSEFVQHEGHCNVPTNTRTEDGFRLGDWVATQRKTKDEFSEDRKEQLQSLRGWVWSAIDEKWESGFRNLEEFARRERHCRVSANYRTRDGYRLGSWVTNQRSAKRSLSAERILRLEAVPGWSWDVLADQWEVGFCHLDEFADREGHCKVPIGYETADGYRLGVWVSEQRRSMDSMPTERKKRLENVTGWIWDVLTENWEEGFGYLKAFSDREGHCQIPNSYKAEDGYRLGQWVSVQRKNVDSVSVDRKTRLEALSGWAWNALVEQWEVGFRHLKEYTDLEGHCRLPKCYRTANGFQLSVWVVSQRAKRSDLSIDRMDRLESLPGWSWDPHTEKWERGFSYLKAYADCEGHCRVPVKYRTPDEYRLGQWVQVQRSSWESVSKERKERLETLPGWLQQTSSTTVAGMSGND